MRKDAHCTISDAWVVLNKSFKIMEPESGAKILKRHSTSPCVWLQEIVTPKGNEEKQNRQVSTMRKAYGIKDGK